MSTESSSNTSPIMSPIQTAGPLSLTVEDIRARMSGQESEPRPSIDEVMPALASEFNVLIILGLFGSSNRYHLVMRTGEQNGASDELLLNTQMPSPPMPAHQSSPKSPIMGAMPMQPMPANVMSPDDMLRAYAERRAMGGAMGAPSMPAPAANYNGNGMRTLYSPEAAAPVSPDSAYPAMLNRKSLAPTEYSKYDEEDAYVGTAE